MIYCTSGDTVKCVVVRLTSGMYSSCLHSMTKERPCEEERSQMNAARNGKLPRVQQHKCVLLAFASVCIRSLGLEGRQTQKALKVLLSSFLQPPGPLKVQLIQGTLCLFSATGRQAKRVEERSRLRAQDLIVVAPGVGWGVSWRAGHVGHSQDFGVVDIARGREKYLISEPFSGMSHVVNIDVLCDFGFILKFLEAGIQTVSGSQIFPLMKLPNATLKH